MDKSRRVPSFVLALVALAAAAAAGPAPRGIPPMLITDRNAAVRGNNRFALALYAKLSQQAGNLFFSPHSLSTALAMTYGGARGGTQRQMHDVLRLPVRRLRMDFIDRHKARVYRVQEFPMSRERIAAAFGALQKALKADGKKRGYELHVANALWGRKGHAFLPAFLDLTRKHYGAGLKEVDFRGNPEAARRTINAWVEKQTREKIKELLRRGVITPVTALVLTNAIYFKGNWASQFDKKRTRPAPFYLGVPRGYRGPVKAVQVPMMRQRGSFRMMDGGRFLALELPYAGNQLAMIILLPKEYHTEEMAALEKSLTARNLNTWLGKLRKQEVRVCLPRFRMTSEFSLAKVLAEMGMRDAFDPERADFTGMRTTAREETLHISAVVHKAFVEVNEEGTEAAAATAVVMEDRSGPPVFRADRPFLFLIRHNATSSILFLGRVTNPGRKE